MTQETTVNHNFRKYHKHINKSDKTEPLSVKYYTYTPTQFDNIQRISEFFDTKAQLYDFIEQCLRKYPDLQWSDFQMYKQINQKLVS